MGSLPPFRRCGGPTVASSRAPAMARSGSLALPSVAGPNVTVPLVVTEAVQKYFPLKHGFFANRTGNYIRGVDNVSVAITEGSSLGIAGESGCGKTTLARLLLRLLTPTSGRILFHGVDLGTLAGRDL